MKSPRLFLLAASLAVAAVAAPPETISLAALINPRDSDYEHARPAVDKTATNKPLMIAGQAYAKGLGTQADNRTAIELKGAVRFTTSVGIDDATESILPLHL